MDGEVEWKCGGVLRQVLDREKKRWRGKRAGEKKKADGRAGMCASHLKGGEAHSLLRGCVASLATK